MNKIIDYSVVHTNNLTNLECNMQEAIKLGWQPFGAPFVYVSNDENGRSTEQQICQAVVKYEQTLTINARV